MTPCTCHKWRDQSFRSDINLCVVSSTGGWRYCPWCSASLTAPEKPREEAIPRTDDEFITAAKTAFDIENVNITTSFLQRRFRLGFSRAQTILNEMQRRGLIPKRPLTTQPEE